MKHQIISTLDGIFMLDASGHYVPLDIEEPHPYRGVAILALVITATWAVAVGAGYCAYRALEILAA